MFCVYWIKISFYLLLFLWPLNWKQNIRIICIGEVIEGHPTSTYRLLGSWPGKIIINFLLVNIHSSVVVHWGTYYSVFLLSLDSRGMTWKSGWPVNNSVLFLLQERDQILEIKYTGSKELHYMYVYIHTHIHLLLVEHRFPKYPLN